MPYAAWTFVFLIAGLAAFTIVWVVQAIVLETRKDRVPALLYHHFMSSGDKEKDLSEYHPAYFCTDAAFEEQMKYLVREGYHTISLDDFMAFQAGQESLPSKPIILTFDDGFATNYQYAFPILKKYGLTATIFVTLDPNCRNFQKWRKADRPLTYEEIQEMSDYGISIESHSMTHPYLSKLAPQSARWELEESKHRLEEILKKPIRYIAIPSGAYSGIVKHLIDQIGYKAAFCMLKGTNNKISDRLALRRLVIGRDFNLEDFRRVLQPAGAIHLRLAGSLQNTLLAVLGPGGLDALRDGLYGLGLGALLTRGQVKYVVPCLGATAVFVFGLLVWFLQSQF